ncbi:hypothetical protein PHIN8_12400 [Polynucleobacter sp. HIN8]|uniref:TAXI family TRAP transporter solute-binding subunit n=1 Tax=Polynucleobacter sp. HIN8 TaxID=3047867 RepID=UPI00257319F4|nr:TAXI family TRAP transporter solute-binding subunit [Polynucleobacter sp. HIN8]BEI39296.1 hypothetical protein PHIN8_12400 [Polynucleobacter sp. HIN8]
MEIKKGNYLKDLISYFQKDFARELSGWLEFTRYHFLLIIGAILLLFTLVVYVNPIPPKQAFLATGQMGSSYQLISEQIDQFFSGKGIDLVLVDTAGLHDGLQKLKDQKSPVNAGFVTSGSANQKDFPNLVSMGSIQYSPIWIFYRGKEINTNNPIDYFGDKRISIGLPNTTTQNIFLRLAHDSKYKNKKPSNFYEYSNTEAAEKLLSGDLDAVFIVDGINSPSVQKLIKDKNIHIYDFVIADAYEKQFPFLNKLVIPKGSLNIEQLIPNRDINLIAPTVMLLVERDMHPVMQWSFLLAIKEYGQSRTNFFSKPGYFPRYTDESFELSPIAKRYYDSGIPFLFKYLPLWLASLIDEIWFYVVSLFAVIFPFRKSLSNLREMPSDDFVGNCYQELHELEYAFRNSNKTEELEKIVQKLNILENQISSSWIESSKLGNSYALRNSLARIKNETAKKIEQLNKNKLVHRDGIN